MCIPEQKTKRRYVINITEQEALLLFDVALKQHTTPTIILGDVLNEAFANLAIQNFNSPSFAINNFPNP